MASVSNPPANLPEISQEQRLALERVLASATFSNAPRLRAVLSFLIEGFLSGRTEDLNEQSIGQTVFGRPAGYNPGDDNIVRVTVRHLRSRLEEFYRTEGRDETFVLEIPKGKYIPSLSSRAVLTGEPPVPKEAGSASVPVFPGADSIPGTLSSAPKSGGRATTGHRAQIRWIVLGVFACLLLVSCFAWIRHLDAARDSGQGILNTGVADQNSVLVVVADSNLQAYREIFRKQVPLASYIDRSYTQARPEMTDPAVVSAWRYATRTQETNVSSAIVAAGIKHDLLTKTVIVKHPHDVSMRDFQQMDIVLLGGPWINPWGQLFEGGLNFRMLPIEGNTAVSQIHNNNRQPGEPTDFIPHAEGNLNVNYVRIALLPNFQKTGSVILVGATSLEALEAGGAYLLAQESLDDLRQRFTLKPKQPLPFLEVVLEVHGLQSVPGSMRIVAQRTVTQR